MSFGLDLGYRCHETSANLLRSIVSSTTGRQKGRLAILVVVVLVDNELGTTDNELGITDKESGA